jgi:polyisoprenoid-binding protein YceI
MSTFEFKKALMQEHFNENYVESDKFPKAVFKGKVSGLPEGALGRNGTYDISIEGDLTMHGVTQHVVMKGTLTVDPTGVLKASVDFPIKPEDYGIKIPSTVRANIAEEIQVKVRVDYQKM